MSSTSVVVDGRPVSPDDPRARERMLEAVDKLRAVKTIHKHHPDVPMSVCRDELWGFVDAYGDAVRLVDDNSEYYRSVKERVPAGRWRYSPEKETFLRAHAGFPVDLLPAMIRFIFDWHHMRRSAR